MEYNLMVLRLRNSTRTGLLTKAEENGFYFRNEEGNTFIPQGGEVAVNGHAQMFYLGKLVDAPATFDEEGNELTPETYKSGWHADIYLSCHHTAEDFDFGAMVTHPVTPEREYGAN